MKLVMKILQQFLMKKKIYRKLKERIRMMTSQKSDAKKNDLTEEGKEIGINEIGIKVQSNY